jgi:hypothetical protein
VGEPVGQGDAPPRPAGTDPDEGLVEEPLRFVRVEHLRHVGWHAYRVESYVNWCGHGQEVIPFPRPDSLVELVPVLGEAT